MANITCRHHAIYGTGKEPSLSTNTENTELCSGKEQRNNEERHLERQWGGHLERAQMSTDCCLWYRILQEQSWIRKTHVRNVMWYLAAAPHPTKRIMTNKKVCYRWIFSLNVDFEESCQNILIFHTKSKSLTCYILFPIFQVELESWLLLKPDLAFSPPFTCLDLLYGNMSP